jgi:heme-degrading monooxygenase HmoA
LIVRTWTTTVASHAADDYIAHLVATGAADYANAAGNLDIEILRADGDAHTELLFISRWLTLDHLRAHIGDDLARAVAYPGDECYPALPALTATNYTIAHRQVRLGHDAGAN